MKNIKTYLELKTIGTNIKYECTRSNLTLSEFSKRIEYDRNSLSQLLNGTKDIRFNTVIKIAKNLDVSVRTLFSRNYIDDRQTSTCEKYIEKDYLLIFSNNVYKKCDELNKAQIYIGTNVESTNRIIRLKNSNPCISSMSNIAFDLNTNIYELLKE